jgi:UDP-glucose 4-epimerase
MRILVTGGAGYIGSHTVRQLKKEPFEPIVLDNLNTGHLQSVEGVPFIHANLLNAEKLEQVIKKEKPDAVVHFAALSLVGESMQAPDKYYENNVGGTLNLLKALNKAGVDKLVFSSTAAVYGQPDTIPITEDVQKLPVNVYGKTKLIIESMMEDFHAAYGMKYVALRYFNAAGADEKGDIGEDHQPESHLIPIIYQVLLGKREKLTVYGKDYKTKDGTCIRDYIHVNDLARAHVLALRHLINGGEPAAYNLGNGKGYSVLEIIRAVEKATGKTVPYSVGERREGDPAVLIASYDKIKKDLKWQPRYGIEDIVKTAWEFHRRHTDGF